MLSIKNNNKSQDHAAMDDALNSIDAAFKGIINLLRSSNETEINFQTRMMRFHKLQMLHFDDNEKKLCRFTYIRNNKPYSFDFPLTTNLVEPCLQNEVRNKAKETYSLPFKNRSKTYNELLFAALSHPIVTIVAGVASGVNLLYLAAGIASVTTVGILTLSLAYFVPRLLYSLNKTRLRNSLLKIFDEVLKGVDFNKYEAAHQKIASLSFMHQIMLHLYFPGNEDLKWSFNYVQSKIQYNEYLVEEAFELSETPEQLFLVLKMFLQAENIRRKGILDRDLEPLWDDREGRRNLFESYEKDFDKHLKKYIKLLPINSQQHQDLGIQLKHELMSCVLSLENCCIEEACDKFMAIEWDGYCKLAYPAAAVLYYELRAILTIATEGLDVKLHPQMFVAGRICHARDTLIKINKIISEHFPDKIIEFKKYLEDFQRTDGEMGMAYVDTDSIKPITTLATMRTKQYFDLLDEPKSDVKNLRIVNNSTYFGF